LALAEAEDARVLEEAPHHRLDPDVVREAGNTRPQATNPADDKLYLHALLAGGVERVYDLGIDQRIHLQPDIGRLAALGVGHLLADMVEQGRAKIDRRDGNGLQFGRA